MGSRAHPTGPVVRILPMSAELLPQCLPAGSLMAAALHLPQRLYQWQWSHISAADAPLLPPRLWYPSSDYLKLSPAHLAPQVEDTPVHVQPELQKAHQ
eukprot:gene12793-biopygen8726